MTERVISQERLKVPLIKDTCTLDEVGSIGKLFFLYFFRSHCNRTDSCRDCGPSSRVSSPRVQIHEIKTQL